MNPFNVGDTVRVLPSEAQPHQGLYPNKNVTVEHADETHVRVSGSRYEWNARRFELVERATPAPLDPSKVRTGDTVTLLVDPPDTHPSFTVAGETHSLGGPTVYLGGWRVDDLPDYVTLTAHQPAPEPEPLLRGLYSARYMGSEPTAMWASDGGSGAVFRNDEGDEFAPEELADVRPLVVIDPASDYVQGLIRLAHDKAASPEGERDRALVRDLLKGLRIEAP